MSGVEGISSVYEKISCLGTGIMIYISNLEAGKKVYEIIVPGREGKGQCTPQTVTQEWRSQDNGVTRNSTRPSGRQGSFNRMRGREEPGTVIYETSLLLVKGSEKSWELISHTVLIGSVGRKAHSPRA